MSGNEPLAATTLDAGDIEGILADLRTAHARFARSFAGDSAERQPVHTVYGGAQLFRADSARKIGALALQSLDQHAPDAGTLAAALGMEEAGSRAGTTARTHRRQADARAGRGLSDRFRGRIRASSRRRRRRALCERRGGSGRGFPARNAPAFHRDTHQAGLGGAPPAQPAHARSVRHGAGAGARRRICPGLPGHHSEGRRCRADRRCHRLL